jgi:hypothetical protein
VIVLVVLAEAWFFMGAVSAARRRNVVLVAVYWVAIFWMWHTAEYHVLGL